MWRTVLADAALLLQIVFLTCAVVFVTIAARGYHGTAWGDVLRPLPLGLTAFTLSVGVRVFEGTALPVHLFSLLAWIPAVGAVALSTYRLVSMVSGRGGGVR